MAARVGAVDSACEDRDRVAAGGQRSLVGGAVDAAGAAGDDGLLVTGEAAGEVSGDVCAVVGGGSGTGDRDTVGEPVGQE